jgi:hypothetical protein
MFTLQPVGRRETFASKKFRRELFLKINRPKRRANAVSRKPIATQRAIVEKVYGLFGGSVKYLYQYTDRQCRWICIRATKIYIALTG